MENLTNDIPTRLLAVPTVHAAFAEARQIKPWGKFSHPVIRQTASRIGLQWIKCGDEQQALADFTKEYLTQMDRWDAGLFHVEHHEPLGAAESREYIKRVKEVVGI